MGGMINCWEQENGWSRSGDVSTTTSLSSPTLSMPCAMEDDDPTSHRGSQYQEEMARAIRRRGGGWGRYWKHWN
jgi:hypothetical protein